MRRSLLLAGLVVMLSVAAPARAAIYGLVLGVDAYVDPAQPSLRGAVNDARDIADALATFGAAETVLLVDEEVRRDTVIAAWNRLIEQAAPGDTLLFTFAGHGAQEPTERHKGETDGKDEVLLLAAFGPAPPDNAERLVDDELGALFRQATAAGLQVVAVIDSCHSGTLFRNITPSTGSRLGTRLASPYQIVDDALALLELPTEDERGIDGVTYIGAGQDHQRIPEISVATGDGGAEVRGALSLSFAALLREQATHGVVRRGELQERLVRSVRSYAQGQQTPSFFPVGAAASSIVLERPAAAPPPALLASGSARPSLAHETVPVAAVNGPVPDRPWSTVRWVDDPADALLVWDVGCRRLAAPAGDWSGDVDATTLEAHVEKWRMMTALRHGRSSRLLDLELKPHVPRLDFGIDVALAVDGRRHPFLTVFSVAADGSVFFLYPLARDAMAVAPDAPFRITFTPVPPGGEDHVVALASEVPLVDLHAVLEHAQGRGRGAAGAVLPALEDTLALEALQLGVIAVFTGDEPPCFQP